MTFETMICSEWITTTYPIQRIAANACTFRSVCGSRQRYDPAKTPVATHPTSSRGDDIEPSRQIRLDFGQARADRQPIRPNLVPLLNKQSLSFEGGADLGGVPSHDLFQNGDQYTQRVVTENSTLGDLRNAFGFRYRDREPLAPIHVQHHMDVGAAVTHVDNSIASTLHFRL